MRAYLILGTIILVVALGPVPGCGDDSGPTEFCGDGYCTSGTGTYETCSSCPTDCGSCCGNGSCRERETCSTCPADCACGADQTCVSGVCTNACLACYTAWCSAEGAACDASPACVEIVTCQAEPHCPRGDTDCMYACYGGHTGSESRLVYTLASCVNAHCSVECPNRLPALP